MKADEHRELPAEGLGERLDETLQEYFNLRFQNATGQLENFGQLRRSRKDIARILTVIRERELGIEVEAKQPEAKRKWRKSRPVLVADELSPDTENTDEAAEADEASADTRSETPKRVARASASPGEGSMAEEEKVSDG
jgi:large subunit ribosomal protein L29